MSNKYVFPFAALIVFFIVSCKCHDKCPAFDEQNLTYIPYEQGHTYQFTNTSGTKISFQETERTTSDEYDADVKHDEFGGCSVQDCLSNAFMSATANISRNGKNTMEVALVIGGDLFAASSVKVLDFTGYFDINNGKLQNGNHGYISASERLGPHQYNNLLVMNADTMTNPDQKIWQVYFSQYGGLVGFRDRQTQSLFYLD